MSKKSHITIKKSQEAP